MSDHPIPIVCIYNVFVLASLAAQCEQFVIRLSFVIDDIPPCADHRLHWCRGHHLLLDHHRPIAGADLADDVRRRWSGGGQRFGGAGATGSNRCRCGRRAAGRAVGGRVERFVAHVAIAAVVADNIVHLEQVARVETFAVEAA